MYVSKKTAVLLESCIKQSHIEFTKLYDEARILEINGGAACFSGFDSFFSQVVGWGFATQPKQFKAEIETIERFYQSLSHPRVDIELCPFVGNDLTCFLSQRGYGITELNNVSVLDLQTYEMPPSSHDDFIIKEIMPAEFDEWATQVAVGFGFPEAKEQFSYYVRAKGITVFAAYHDDKLVAGGTVAIHGDVCDLAVTSTLAAYREKGLQKKLLEKRLNFAKQQGVALATVTTEPGTVSDLNIQKLGFHCAYTRIKMTLEPLRK